MGCCTSALKRGYAAMDEILVGTELVGSGDRDAIRRHAWTDRLRAKYGKIIDVFSGDSLDVTELQPLGVQGGARSGGAARLRRTRGRGRPHVRVIPAQTRGAGARHGERALLSVRRGVDTLGVYDAGTLNRVKGERLFRARFRI